MTSSSLFNSTGDYAQITDNAAIQDPFASGGTCSFWVYLNSSPGAAYRVIDKTGGTSVTPSSGWMIYQHFGSPLRIRTYISFSSSFGIWQADTVISATTWTHVTMTMDTSSSSNNPSFYVNGSTSSTTETSTPSGSYDSDVGNDLFLGGNHNNDRGFNGNLCHWQLWDRVLSAAEVAESMYKPGTVRTNLVGYWPGMGQDSPMRDLSGNGNTATINSVTGSAIAPLITMSR